MPVVLLRRFREEDAPAARVLVEEATMSTVTPFFQQMATREMVSHAALMLAAVSFVLAGAPLQWSLLSLPLTLLVVYVGVWLAHRIKLRHHGDMDFVEDVYLASNRTGFWVAEVVDESFAGTRYEVEGDYTAEDLAGSGGEGRLVGTIAVVEKEDPDMREPPGSVAWLRRMAVGRRFQRQGLGAKLVDLVMDHCAEAGFRAIELVTTEAHEPARCLYTKKGFEIVQQYQDHYLLGLVSINMFRFRKACVRDSTVD